MVGKRQRGRSCRDIARLQGGRLLCRCALRAKQREQRQEQGGTAGAEQRRSVEVKASCRKIIESSWRQEEKGQDGNRYPQQAAATLSDTSRA